jgi:hypothetical protein
VENQMVSDSERAVRWWKPLLFAALAGGMGWGIRGQYGHETGAMIAGALVSLTLVFLLCPNWRSLPAAHAVAWGTVAMGIGGTMTYGQTMGLTQNPDMIGNWAAYWDWVSGSIESVSSPDPTRTRSACRGQRSGFYSPFFSAR